MVSLERSTRRVGRSQAASIFWGLVSVFFAGAACYYFWKYHENETSTDVLRDTAMNLRDQLETLKSQKDQLQSNLSESETQLKTREDFVQEKEAALAQEESRLQGVAAQTASQSDQSRNQSVLVKKFNDAMRKLVKDADTDVVVRGGRPVLRVPSSVFFDFGESSLKPEGRILLKQIAQALDGQLNNFELRVDVFTDSGGESDPAGPPDKSAVSPAPSDDKAAPPKPEPGWELTGRRAGVLARYLREQTPLPFQNILVVPRADFQPIIPSGTEGHARNRRVEITIAPTPAAYRPGDNTTGQSTSKSSTHDAKASSSTSDKTTDHAKSAARTSTKPLAKAPPNDDDSSPEKPAPKTAVKESSRG